MSPFSTSLDAARRTRGWSQARLAVESGVSRASVSAIETGRLVPSTAAALRLARALGTSVEALFQLQDAGAGPAWAWPAPPHEARAWEAVLGRRRLAFPYESTSAGLLPHDAHLRAGRLHRAADAFPPARTLVLAGCDPSVGLLVQQVAAQAGIRVLPLQRSSGEALDLLRRGLVHAAGLHLSHGRTAGTNEAVVRRTLGPRHALLHVMRWDEGVVLHPGLHPGTVRGLLAGHVRWVNREEGSGARRCLDRLLGSGRRPAGYHHVVRDHRAVAATVASGWADAGICVRSVAQEMRLDFLSVQQEAYELCFPADARDEPRIAALVETVRSAAYRRLVADLPGCSAEHTGATRDVR